MIRLACKVAVRLTLIFVVAFSLVCGPLYALRAAKAEPHSLPFKPATPQQITKAHKRGEMIVKFKDDAPQAMRDFVIQTYGKNDKELRGRGKGRKLTIKDNLDLSNVLFEVKQMDSIIEFAEPNYIVTGTGTVSDVKNDKARATRNRRVSQASSTPNDSQFGAQWALNNTGQGGGAFGSDIGAITGWQKVKGDKDTVVAVIDTGVDTRHPDLARNLWSNKREANGKKNEDDDRDGYVDNVSGWNFVNDTPNVMDDHGHGTAMAGILAAEANNHQGIAGVMWQASLMPLKALDSTGSGAISDVVEAIDFAVSHGAGVINCSFGTEAFSQSLLDAISRAASSGVLIVASAGNNGWDLSQTPYYPASYAASNLIAVAATNNSDLLATFSNYGANNVHVAAPGVDVLTTYPNNQYITLTGTSAAAPLVAGVAGLLKSRRGFVSAQWIRKVIVDSARKVSSLNGKVSSGGVVSAGESIALFIKNEEEGGLAGGSGGGPGGGGSGGGGGTGGGPGGQLGAMNLDVIRNNHPNAPEPRVTVNNVPSVPYDDPEPGVGGLGGYFYQESLPKNSTGVAGGKVGENADPTDGDAAGQSSINLGSQNVNFAAPIVSLGGRGGLGVSLALYYNSNIYVKNGSSIAFNTDKDVAGVGWSIGFGSIEGVPSGSAINSFWDSTSGKYAFLFIRPDGGRHVLAQVGSSNIYASYDSTWLEFDNANKILRTMNGTQISFMTPTYGGNAIGKRLLPSQIKDRNGNYITITNAEISNGNGVANNSHDWGIDYITDTMGRTIDFYYESNLLRKVRQNRSGTYFDFVVLSYAPVTISTNFSGLTTDPSTLNGTQVWMPWWIEYPTGHTHRIFYTSYGQMYSVEKWVPTVAGQGNGRPVAFTRYDMQSVSGLSYPSGALVGTGGNTAQTDCPKFSLRQEWAENWSPTSASSGWTALSSGGTTYYVAQYSYEFNTGSNFSKVIDPIDRVFRTDVSTDGLTHTSKTYASQSAYSGGSGTPLKTATITYEKDTGLSYTSNLRVQNVQITDGSYTRRTNYTYTTVGGATLPYDVKEYLGDATNVYRYTRTNYNSSTTYSNKHIFGLPSEVLVYKGDNTLVAKTAFTYDESGYFDTSSYTVTNHDTSNYGTGYVAGRANLTTVTQFEVPGSASRAVSHTKFDMLGNTRAAYDGANHITEFFYDDNFVTTGNPTTRALVTKVKDPDSYWSGAKYNYHTGQAAQSYHIAGTSGAGSQENIITYTYNSVDRLIAVTQPSGHGGQVTRDYWDNWMAVAEYVTIDSGKTRYSFVAYDGAGQTRWNGSDHPDGASGKYAIQTFGYDSVGRTKYASNPTAADGGLSTNYPAWDEDYYFGWLYTTITYDALDRQTVITRPDDHTVQYSYTGCGCAGTSQVTVTDERGKKRKTVYDFLGRLSEAYNLTSASATYAKAVYSYDERDLLQNIKHYNNGSAYQERTFGYDGYGRLTSQTTPEAGTASYEYWADDTVKKITDARSLYAQFTYNNRRLVTVVDYSDSTLDVNYSYGEYGERTLMQEKSGSTVMASTSYSYDSFKRLSSETRSFNGLSGSYSVGYTYNYADALKQVSYTVGAWSKSVNYDYNYAGAPTKVGSNLRTGDTTNNVATAFDFRAWGALQKADYANGRRLALGYNQKRGQMTNLKLQKTDNSDVVTNISYDYYNGGGGSGGNNGRVRYITDHLDGNYSVDVGYDDHNRLTSYGSYRSYTYDAWNNLLSVSSSNGVGEAPNYTLTYATNASGAPSTNRINNSGYTYDNAGNVTNDGSLAYAYDAAGRLKTAGSNNSCEYDGDGRKVKQVSGGYPLFYLWSSVLGEPVVELDGSGGVYRAYVLNSGGQMLAVQSYDGGFYWLHTDHLGNGRKLTNSSGAVIYRAEFDPHGQMLYEWQSSGATYLNSHKFTGYERDWATNLNYAKARTYNHNRARFMQPDPLGFGAADSSDPQSLNQYSYVGNDPVNYIDPSGLSRTCYYEIRDYGYWRDDITYVIGQILVAIACFEGGGGPYQPVGGTAGGGDSGGGGGGGVPVSGSQNGQSAKEIAKCLGKGLVVGAVGALAVGALAVGAVALGAPIAAVTGVLGGLAILGAVVIGADIGTQVRDGNAAGVAYSVGSIVGGAVAGGASGGAVANGIKPGATAGLSLTSNIAQRFRPSLGSVGRWLGTGPTNASAGAATAVAGAGAAAPAKGGC